MGKEENGVVTRLEKGLVENEIDEFGRQLIITIHLVSAYSPHAWHRHALALYITNYVLLVSRTSHE
jgi:hypothetical protein